MRVNAILLGFGASASALSGSSQQPIHLTSSAYLSIPPLGFGTWNLSPDSHNASRAVEHALKTGYRHIDCAAIYRNEPDVGRGIIKGLKAADLKREDIWVTSKLWNDHHEALQVPIALAKTLKDLGVGYLDLYLMHWPVGDKGGEKEINFVETWKAMEKLVGLGLVRHIGVSNFAPQQLRDLLAEATIKPYAHQMELHPYLPQSAWLQYHREQGIHVTAYSPLGNSNPTYHKSSRRGSPRLIAADSTEGENKDMPPALLELPVLQAIAKERDCTPATVALAWGLSRGYSVIPKSQHKSRIEENFQGCELEYEDIRALQRIGMSNLTRFNNPSKGWGVPLYDGLQDA